ncbi:hypothetical protein, partial [Xylanibacter brevis]|uniref:hypothetical protein n=1 Tax=Xylanibacter brevis TaxID=83231 RepID=UPI001B7FF86F
MDNKNQPVKVLNKAQICLTITRATKWLVSSFGFQDSGFRFQVSVDSSRVAALQRCSYKNKYCIYQNLTLYLYINIEVF